MDEKLKCSADGCDNRATRRGMCGKHYKKWERSTPPEDREPIIRPVAHAAVVDLFGGVRRFCAAVGIDPTTFYRWKGSIPADRHPEILAGGDRAGVKAEDLKSALGWCSKETGELRRSSVLALLDCGWEPVGDLKPSEGRWAVLLLRAP